MKASLLLAVAVAVADVVPASAAAQTFAPGFVEHTTMVDGRPLFYRIGGSGPAVILIHGFGDTGEMWAPLAPRLAAHHTVIVPDLPGLGQSRPESPSAR